MSSDMDFNRREFIDAVLAGKPFKSQPLKSNGVEVRVDLPNRNPWQNGPTRMIYLDRFVIAHVFPFPDPELGPHWEIQWILAGHSIDRATEVLNVLGTGLLMRPLVRLLSGKPHQVHFDGTFKWEEEITTPILLSSNRPGQEC